MFNRTKVTLKGFRLWTPTLCIAVLLLAGPVAVMAEDPPPPPPTSLLMQGVPSDGPEIPEALRELIGGAGAGESSMVSGKELMPGPETFGEPGPPQESVDGASTVEEGPQESESQGTDGKSSAAEAPDDEEELSDLELYFRGIMPTGVSTELRQFGYETFERTISTFAPITDVPVGPDYVIGPGDQLAITLWGRVEGTYRVDVDRNGEVTLPKVGVVKVWGLKFADIKDFLRQEFDKYFSDFDLNVTLSQLRTIRVYVVGEVVNPGSYSLSSLSTAFNALFAAGGPSSTGSMRAIKLIRNQAIIGTIDLYDFLLKGDKGADQKLLSQDTLFVPPVGPVVGIAGQVKRPAIYELNGSSTLEEVIEIAGGLQPTGYLQRVQIERVVPHEERIALDFDLSERMGKKEKFRIPLKDRDLVKISPIYHGVTNVVYLRGHVIRPGDYEFREGMRVTDLLPKKFDDLNPEPYLEFARVVRYEEPDYHRKVIPFHLGRALDGDPDHNLKLRYWDMVEIYPKAHFENQKIVDVEGEVRHPGTFMYHHEMRVSDLLALAGGPSDESFSGRAEVSRMADYWEPEYGRELVTFNLEKALAGDLEHDLPVQPLDIVKVYSKWDLQDEPQVVIEGEVRNPGSFVLEKGMRVSDLVRRAGDITRTALLEEGQLFRRLDDYRLVTIPFDLGKALEGDEAEDVVLLDLDRVVIHSLLERQYIEEVTVSGMVQTPGTYELAVDMTVRDLVLAAGNLVKNAYQRSSELTRFHVSQEGVETEYIEFDMERALLGDPEHNHPLQDYDHLVIRKIPELEIGLTVEILGEVQFPGRYPIRKGERLSSLLTRSGGYTKDAYLKGAVFSRETVKTNQREALDKMRDDLEQDILADTARSADTALSMEDLSSLEKSIQARRMLLEQMKRVDVTGRLVIKLSSIEALAAGPMDLVLEPEDSLVIPAVPSYISVLGSVYNPTSILFEKGHTVNYYLSKVGGPTASADKKQIYVVRANGTVVSREQEGYSGIFWDRGANEWVLGSFYGLTLDPGDTIIVPEETKETDYLEFAGKITRMIFELSTAAGVVAAASK